MTSKSEFTLSEAIDFQPLTVKANTSVTDVISLLSQNKASCVLVIERQILIGIFTERDVIKMTANREDAEKLTVADVMSRKIISIAASEIKDVFSVSDLMRSHKIRHLPVLDELNQLIGVITPTTIRRVFKPTDMLRSRLVCELMETKVIQASPLTNILDIALIMAENRISCVVISEKNHQGKNYPAGIITEVDIVRLRSRGLDFSSTLAKQVMSQPLKPVKNTDSVWLAHQKMEQESIRRLVVVDSEGELSGIITQTSLLRVLDPIEMQILIQILKQTVNEQTQQLQKQNQALQKEIQERRSIEAALTSSEINYRQIAEKLETANRQLRQLANFDGLTGLANRYYFDDCLQREWKRSVREQTILSLIMCDVDYFKKFNDTYGHQSGDECLRQIAKIFKQVIKRPADLAARYGGEEFIILLPNTELEGAIHLAKQICTAVKSLEIPHIKSDTSDFVTISLGVAATIPSIDESPQTLIAVADKNLYKAKSSGRNCLAIEKLAVSS